MVEPGPGIVLRGAEVRGHGRVDLRIERNRIEAIAPSLEPMPGDRTYHLPGRLIAPGLVNTHHHLAQSILKGVPGGLGVGLRDWLVEVPYRYWPRFTPDDLYTAARIGLAELVRSGCTTCADHHYLYAADTSPEMESALFAAAAESGIRFVLCRGGASGGMTHPGLLAAGLEVEDFDLWLSRMADTCDEHHSTAADAMTRVAVAPTSFMNSTTPDHLRQLARFARAHGMKLHSHLLEIEYDAVVAREREGTSASRYAEAVEWLGPDVWFAHLVHADADDIALLGATGTGVSHCPVSNARLGSGIAKVPHMAAAGMAVTLGVDGSGSAEAGSVVTEMHWAWLLHRALSGPEATTAGSVMEWATAAGAELLGWPDSGRLEAGALADLVVFDQRAPRFAGLWSPDDAPVLCGEPVSAEYVIVDGRFVVSNGRHVRFDDAALHAEGLATIAGLRSRVP